MLKDLITQILATGMSQAEVASRLGISQTHVSCIASGKRGKRVGFELGQRILRLHSELITEESDGQN